MIRWIRLFGFLFLFCTAGSSRLYAQELTGIWRGHFRGNEDLERVSGNYDDRYKIEVQIAQLHNRFEAVTYSYKSTEFYGKAEATGTFNRSSRKVLLKEGKLLEVHSAGGVCVMTCFLQYSKLGNDEYLQGTFYSVNAEDSTSGCGKGSIFLHRVAESDFYKEPFLEKREKELLALKKENKPAIKSGKPADSVSTVKNLPAAKQIPSQTITNKQKTTTASKVKSSPASGRLSAPAVASVPNRTAQKKSSDIMPEQSANMRDSSISATKPSETSSVPFVLKSRSTELLKTLTVHSSNIELRIYDDGAIDNDTVSVYYDNKLIISKARLTDQPITVHIEVEPGDRPHQLVMVAENLGEIPPNTSLLVVRDGEKRYEERIISTEQKNIAINFVYKKIE